MTEVPSTQEASVYATNTLYINHLLDMLGEPTGQGKRPMNPSFVFGGTAGYWVHERNKQFEQSRGAQSILA